MWSLEWSLICLHYFSHSCCKISDQGNLRTNSYLAHSLKMQKSWLQKYEEDSYVRIVVKKQGEKNSGASLAFSFVLTTEITPSFFKN